METSNSPFLESVLGLLWRQWSTLGVSSSIHNKSDYVIDPEALLLFSTQFARYDARLFDEVLDWVLLNGKLINLQRLQNLQKSFPQLANAKVLAAIGGLASEKATLQKWKPLKALVAHEELNTESLFLDLANLDMPFFGKEDTRFKVYGLLRSPYLPTSKSNRPNVSQQACLLMKLRALFGVHARAEVMTYLLTHFSAHPAEIAQEMAYYTKTIQDCLNEMELSSHIHSFSKGREKHFRINPDEWKFLQTSTSSQFPGWMDWVALFSCISRIWTLETDPKWMNADSLLKQVEQQKILSSYQPLATNNRSQIPILDHISNFIENL